MQAMKIGWNNKIKGKAKIDEAVVSGQEKGVVGRKNGKKKLEVFAIEKKRRGVSRLYGKIIEHSGATELGNFMKANIVDDLLNRIMAAKPYPYKMIIC